MQRCADRVKERTFDLLIIGGGIYGACAACDAAQRGLSVALVEKGDFSEATSAQSFKIIHGGLRYLQHGDIPRIRESSRARRVFLRAAPHLCHPLEVVVPTYGWGMKGKAALRAAMSVYDGLTIDRNRGIQVKSRRVPRGRTLIRDQVLRHYPGLEKAGLTGAGVFADGQMYNPTRLVLAAIQRAAAAGAVVLNRMEVTGLRAKAGRVVGAVAWDHCGQDEVEIKARSTLNTSGPYAERLLREQLQVKVEPPLVWSRDAYFVVDRKIVEGHAALAIQGQTRDSDAVINRGERHLFLAPWHGRTLVGVWHGVYEGHPEDYHVTDAELEGFVAEVNEAYPEAELSTHEITRWEAGLIPFGEASGKDGELKFGHRSRFVDHGRREGLEGLWTLIGARYTTAPTEAPRAVGQIMRRLGKRAGASTLETTRWRGGEFEDLGTIVTSARRRVAGEVDEDSLWALAHNHGAAIDEVLGLVDQDKTLAERIPNSCIIKGEVVHAVREEMALSLVDVALRRTDLATAGHPGRAAIEATSRLMAQELQWDEPTRRSEANELDRALRARQPGVASKPHVGPEKVESRG